MKKIVWTWLLLLCMPTFVMAESTIDLFEVRLVQQADETEEKQPFNKLLLKAIRIELLRLTGAKDILSQPEAETFVKQPKKWLKNYRYEPMMMDGVKVGNYVVFQFDRQRFYQYFQKQGLLIWPLENRPTTLVMGSRKLAGSLVKLDETSLSYLPTLDYRDIAQQLGLPIEMGDTGKRWIYPSNQKENPLVVDSLQTQTARYVLTFQVEPLASGKDRVAWQLFNRNGVMMQQGLNSQGSAKSALNKIFLRLMDTYSKTYREQAQFLGSLTLDIQSLDGIDSLLQIEKGLNQQKPLIHQARLASMNGQTAQFEITYQGDYPKVIRRIAQQPGLVIVDDNAVIGHLTTRWEGIPEVKVDETADRKNMDATTPKIEEAPQTVPVQVVPMSPAQSLR